MSSRHPNECMRGSERLNESFLTIRNDGDKFISSTPIFSSLITPFFVRVFRKTPVFIFSVGINFL